MTLRNMAARAVLSAALIWAYFRVIYWWYR
jgi:hypothetical protein